jgi:gluconate kinase
VGAALAKRLGDGWVFADADAYHPQANIDKMANGQPLNGATAFVFCTRRCLYTA